MYSMVGGLTSRTFTNQLFEEPELWRVPRPSMQLTKHSAIHRICGRVWYCSSFTWIGLSCAYTTWLLYSDVIGLGAQGGTVASLNSWSAGLLGVSFPPQDRSSIWNSQTPALRLCLIGCGSWAVFTQPYISPVFGREYMYFTGTINMAMYRQPNASFRHWQYSCKTPPPWFYGTKVRLL